MLSPIAKFPHINPNPYPQIKTQKIGSLENSPRTTTRTFNKTFNSSMSSLMPLQNKLDSSTKVSFASMSLANKTSSKASVFNQKPYSIIRSSSPEQGDMEEMLDTGKNIIDADNTTSQDFPRSMLQPSTEDSHQRTLETNETPIPQNPEVSNYIETENPRFPNFRIKKFIKTPRAFTEPTFEFQPTPKRKLSPKMAEVEKPMAFKTIFNDDGWTRKNNCYKKIMKSNADIDNKALLGFPSKIKHFDDYKHIDRIKEIGSLESKTDPITVLQSLSRDTNTLPRLYTINKNLKAKSPTINIR